LLQARQHDVEIKRPAEHTEIHLQTQAALTKIRFAASGPNSRIFSPADATIAISAGKMLRRDTALRATGGGFEHVFIRIG
jgi:hypothetical protein